MNRLNQEILVCDWLIISHVTQTMGSDWLMTLFDRLLIISLTYRWGDDYIIQDASSALTLDYGTVGCQDSGHVYCKIRRCPYHQ